MAVERITPDEAAARLGDGWIYLDVRSEPEFERGHPEGAYNIPLMHAVPGRGRAPNPDFAAVVTAVFSPTDKLVVGCASGNRSLRAARLLLDSGFTTVVDMRGGFAGERSPTGQVACEGWQSHGLPVAQTPLEGRGYQALAARRNQ